VWCGVALVASPVIMNPWGLDQNQLPRIIVQSMLVIVSMGASLVAGARVARALVPLGAFLVVLAAAALVSHGPLVSLVGTDSRRLGLLGWVLLAACFVIGLSFDSPDRRRLLLRAVAAVSVPIAVYAVLQRVGVDPFVANPTRLLRPVSTVGNAAFLGAFLAVALVASFGLAISEPGRRRFVWWAIAMLDTVALLLTASRGAWLGALVGLSLVAFRHARGGDRRTLLGLAASVAVVVIVAAVAVPGVALRAASVTRVTQGTAGARLVLDVVGLKAVAQRPMLGWGPDLSRPALHAHIPSNFEAHYGDIRIEDRVHNTLIDITVWSGVIGLGCFVWFLVTCALSIRRSRRDPTGFIVLAAVVAYAVHLLFNFPVPDVDAVVWLLLGSLIPTTRRLPPAPVGAVAPAVIVGLVIFAPPAIGSLQADRQVRLGADAEDRGGTIAALAHYRAAMTDSGNGAVYDEIATRGYLRAQQPAAAVATARLLVAADHTDPFARELLASALNGVALSSGDRAAATEAELITRSLVATYPYDGSVHLELGNALAAQDRFADAKAEYLTASRLDPRRADPLRNLGIMSARAGELKEANLYLRAALILDPNDAAAQRALDSLGK